MKPTIPTTGVLSGAWIAPRDNKTTQQLFAEHEAAAGRPLDIAHDFYRFDKPFPTASTYAHIVAGRTPMFSWNGYTYASIMSGLQDDIIRQRATALKALGVPVFLRFCWEMDGAKKKAWGTPTQFIAAWRHIWGIFQSLGADNVAWVWCPNAWAWDVSTANAAQWYPGDDVVDWIAADGYDYWPAKGRATSSFVAIYARFYAWASAHGKPLMIGEYGCLERPDDARGKAHWLFDARVAMTELSNIKAAVYFDEHKYEDGTDFDWRVDSSTAAYTAYVDMLKDGRFQTR